MCSCLASKASLLRVFHMASVSVDISSVSKNAAALETERLADFLSVTEELSEENPRLRQELPNKSCTENKASWL